MYICTTLFGGFFMQVRKGDVIKGWKVMDLFMVHNGHQNVRHCVLRSTIDNPVMRVNRVSYVKNKLGWPDRRRPDNTKRNTKHGLSGTRIFRIWYAMKYRCNNEESYKDVNVCEDWEKDPQSFYNWSIENGYDSEDESLTLDRIDPYGDYEPSNCRWTDWKTQQRNKKNSDTSFQITAFRETKYFNEWCDDDRCIVLPATLKWRIENSWDPEKAITQPSERKRKLGFKNWAKLNYPEIYKEYQNDTATTR